MRSVGWYLRGAFSEGQSGKRGFIVVTALSFTSKAMGFLREILVAFFFGATAGVDAFVAAQTIYHLTAILLATPFLVVATPMLVDKGLKEGDEAQSRLFGSFGTLALIASLGLSAVLGCLAPLLVRAVGPMFSSDTRWIGAKLVYLMLPTTIGIIFTHLASAYYNARRNFGLPQLSGIILNAGVIGLMFLAPLAGIYSLGIGWSVGYLAAAAALLFPILRKAPIFGKMRGPETKEFIALSSPLLLGYVIDQIYITINRAFASSLPEGSIAALGYAWKLFEIPLVIMTALTTVHLTKASEMASKGEIRSLRRFTLRLIGLGALALIPTSLVVVLFSKPIVMAIFQRGAFGALATDATSKALSCYGFALFPLFGSHIALATFRGMKEFRIPLLMNLIAAFLSVSLNWLLIKPFGIAGLASATTITITVNTIVMLLFMWRRMR
ncbi:MAG: lipid II flippase MurJ [candidate division WOR-3 bacterium]